MNTKIIKLDINNKMYETITAKQGDTESRFLLFHLFDASLPFDLTEKSVRVYGIKPDGTKIFNDLVINDAKKGYCTLELTNQMLSVAGLVKLELVIYKGSKKLSSIPFVLNVISSLNSEDAIVSTNEFTALMNGLAALSEYDTYKSNAKQVPVIKEEVSNLSSQLDTKANKNEVRKNTVLIELSDLSQNVKESMTGGSVAIVGKNAVLNENITRNAVHYENTDFIEVGNNLFNIDTITRNKYLSNGNMVNNSNGWSVSDFIPVLGDMQYCAKNIQHSYFYDENKTKISQITENPFTTPTNCRFIRFSIQFEPEKFFVNRGNVSLGYSEYGYKIKNQLPTKNIAENAVNNENIENNSIHINKLSFVTKPINLLDKNEVKENIGLDNNSGKEILNKDSTFATIFIKVSANTSYSLSPINSNFVRTYYYNKLKEFISSKGNENGLITTPENCEYIRVTVYDKSRLNQLCLIESDTLQSYVDGTPKILKDYLPINDIKNDIMNVNEVNKNKTKNLFNRNTVTLDKYLNNGNMLDNSNGWKVSDFIEVEPNEQYIMSRDYKLFPTSFCFFYDENKNKISEITENPFTTPTNCKFIRLSIQTEYEFLQVEKGNEIGYFIPYGFEEDYKDLLNSKWLNKKLVCIGDSITDGSKYQILVARATGMIRVLDNGVYGTTVSMARENAMSSDGRINIIPLDTDVITIMGGSNDWGAYNILVGNIDDCAMGDVTETENTLTFMGAYQLMLNKLYKRLPNARIVIFEQPFRANMTPTAEGKVLDDFRKATREIAYKYGYPLIKTYQNAGINQLNYQSYLRDVVHPNDKGVLRLSEIIISGFSNF